MDEFSKKKEIRQSYLTVRHADAAPALSSNDIRLELPARSPLATCAAASTR